MICLLYFSCFGRTYSGISYLFPLHFSHDRWGWAFGEPLLWRPVDQSCPLFYWFVSYLLIGIPDMSSLSVVSAVIPSPILRLVFSLHRDVFWWPQGWVAIKLSLLPAFCLLFSCFFFWDKLHHKAENSPFPLLQGITSPGSHLWKAEKTFFIYIFFLFFYF